MRLKKIVVMSLLFMLVFPVASHALGLGKIQVNSTLYQPLDAEIPVFSVTPEDEKTLNAVIASNQAFEKAGMEKTRFVMEMNVGILKKEDGRYVLKVTSLSVAKEPVINFLLELQGKKGKVVRAFTVLLDSR